jgi:hypothetical protein
MRAVDLDAPALAAVVARAAPASASARGSALASSSIGSMDASGLLSPRATGGEDIDREMAWRWSVEMRGDDRRGGTQ